MNKTITIMGGSFNPIHNGHIELAKTAYEQFELDRILVMPSYNPSSYKDTSELVSANDRCNMVSLAIEDYPYMELSTLEIERGGKTYTADTLAQLLPDYNYIYFIIGADSLFALDHWYKPEYVMKNCHFLVANRNEYPISELSHKANELRSHYGAKISFINMSDVPISSSDIRQKIKLGRDISHMLPNTVYDYIKRHNLYNCNISHRNTENCHE
ncbi:MAG: nicotinate (nicotinamide) nucleotide adenylyltransferase [Lachnospira sp.]|nr:nicotinate (nicotinamide) nucleotide adenylyltransferase [Lachnospira sp.]